MIRAIAVRTAVSVAIVNGLPLALAAQTAKQGFETMAQTADPQADCKVPKPPRELDSFAYIRNGYREILRITATQAALETEICDCPFKDVDWNEVIVASEDFVTSDNPKLPFDVISLRERADALEKQIKEMCEG